MTGPSPFLLLGHLLYISLATALHLGALPFYPSVKVSYSLTTSYSVWHGVKLSYSGHCLPLGGKCVSAVLQISSMFVYKVYCMIELIKTLSIAC